MKRKIITYAENLAEINARLRQCVGSSATNYRDYLRHALKHLEIDAITPDNVWQVREFARWMARGFNMQFAFLQDHYWTANARDFNAESDSYRAAKVLQQTWLRLSEKDPTLVSYYASAADAQRDRLTTGKLGRYLTRYFSWKFDGPTIAEIVNRHVAEHTPPLLKFATTADDIQYVYENGPSSCMAYALDNFSSSVHPVRVYAGPDTAVAYLETLDGRITARSVVIPRDKYYTRCYGNDDILQDMLEKEGYRCKEDGLNGYRVTAIRDGRYLVMPYLDWCGAFDYDEDDEYVYIHANGQYNGRETNGYSNDYYYDDRPECDECGDRMDSENLYTTHEGHEVCHYCSRNSYREAVVDTTGRTARVHHHNCFHVASTDRWYHEDLNNDSDMEALGLRLDSYTGDWMPENAMVEDHAGDWIQAARAIAYTDGALVDVSEVELSDLYDPVQHKLVDPDTDPDNQDAMTLHDMVYNICFDSESSEHACTRLRSDSGFHDLLHRKLINWVIRSIWAEALNNKECEHGRETAAIANADV